MGVATVSRVVNSTGAVADSTRTRVESAIRELGFLPSRAARSLRRGQPGFVGVLVSGVAEASVGERLRGLAGALAPLGLDPVLFEVGDVAQRDRALGVLVGEGVASAVVAISLGVPQRWGQVLAARGGILVSIDHPSSEWPSCAIDNVFGGRLAAEHLIGLGHERIGFVGDRPRGGLGFSASAEREQGLRTALAAAGLGLRSDWVRHPPFGLEEAAASVHSLLASRDRPTAVFVASDVQAMGVLRTAAALGLRVPGDVSIVGFDDVELAGVIGLTTVRQPLAASGRWAAAVLESWLAGREVRSSVEWLPLELVVRSTTRRVAPRGRKGVGQGRI